MNNLLLNGRVALVTGASSGIGAATARALAAQGATVLVGYRSGAERAEAVVASLPGSGHAGVHVDLAQTDAHDTLAGRVRTTAGRLDMLVNSGGSTQRIAHADLSALSPDLFSDMLAVNVVGVYSVTRALLPLLREGGNSVVVNVSSVSAFTGLGSNIAYCAAKAALDTMTMSMARAFGPAVRFLCVSPASVDTDFVAGRSREELEKKAAATPLGRVVTPQDVAEAIVACATQLRTATGTRIVIDGGHTL